MRLSDISPRSQVAAGIGVLLLVAGVLLHPYYLATGLFVFTGTLLLVTVVLMQTSFARLITSISPARGLRSQHAGGSALSCSLSRLQGWL